MRFNYLLGLVASIVFFGCAPAVAQWQVPLNTVPLGRGSGTGFGNAAVGTNNQAFMGSTGAAPGFRSLVGADLPNPSASSLGGIKSITSLAHNWIAFIDTAGLPHQSQPTWSDLGGSIPSGLLIPGYFGLNLNTQTGNYTVQTSDCSGTVQAGTGATGFFTVTFPSTSGFPSTCAITVTNGDTGRGKAVVGAVQAINCSSRNIIWPGQSCTVGIVNGSWAVITRPGRWRPPVNFIVNFNTDFVNGSDTTGATDGLGTGAAAFKTAELCFLTAADQIDSNTVSQTQVLCNMAAATADAQGMHSPLHALTGAQGGAAMQIVGASLAITGAVSNGGLCEITVPSTATYSANQAVSVYGVGVTGAPISFTNSSASITWTGNGLASGQVISFATTGALPTNFSAATNYYVVSTGTNTIQVSGTPGGAAIIAGSAGSGTQTAFIVTGGCNGAYKVTITDGTHLTEQGSIFPAGATFTSGGTVTNGSSFNVTGNTAVACYFGTVVQFANLTFISSNGAGVAADFGCKVYLNPGNIFGSIGDTGILVEHQSQIHLEGDIGISGSATNDFARAQFLGLLVSDAAININIVPGINPSFSGLGFVYADTQGQLNFQNITINTNGNTVTGPRFHASTNGVITTALGAGSLTYFPGSTAGSVGNGATYDTVMNTTVAQGGTGAQTLTAHGLVIGEGTSAVGAVGPCNSNVPITGTGATTDPQCGGTIPVANGGTGQATSGAAYNALASITAELANIAPVTASAITSTTGLMVGAGSVGPCTLTPASTGRIHVQISGTFTGSAAATVSIFSLRYADNSVTAAPANGASPVGTNANVHSQNSVIVTGLSVFPFNMEAEITGLTLGHAYWFDLVAGSSAGTNTVGYSCSGFEH